MQENNKIRIKDLSFWLKLGIFGGITYALVMIVSFSIAIGSILPLLFS